MLSRQIDRFLQGQRWLEPLGDALQKFVGGFYKTAGAPGPGLKSFMHGTWLGHPLHPVITDIPVGAWTLGVVFDIAYLFAQRSGIATAADVTIGIGLLASIGAALTGFTDWNETYDRERRVGLAHGLLNVTAIILYFISFVIRGASGPRALAIFLALVGYVVVVSAAYLGGELVFNIGTGVNHHAWQSPPTEFVSVLPAAKLKEGALQKVMADGTPILLYKQGSTICAIGETCSHAGGPLSEGKLEKNMIICPWHASRFDICTGAVRGGPATISEVRYETRVQDGQIQVRRSAETLQLN